MTLSKEVEDLYDKNFKSLKKEIKDSFIIVLFFLKKKKSQDRQGVTLLQLPAEEELKTGVTKEIPGYLC
jgi:plasmid replication initiation protein